MNGAAESPRTTSTRHAIAVFALLSVACDSNPAYVVVQVRQPATVTTTGAATARESLPKLVVATSSTRIGDAANPSERFATPGVGLPLIVESVDRETAHVRVDGDIELRGIVKIKSLGVVVCEAGLVGDHFYASRGDVLTLRSTVNAGRVDVAASVVLRKAPYSENISYDREFETIHFSASIPESRLCTSRPPKHAGTDADPILATALGENSDEGFSPTTPEVDIDKGRALTLLDVPLGAALYTRPPDAWGYSLKVIEQNGSWMRVAAGSGPYLLGWIPSQPAHVPSTAQGSVLGTISGEGPFILDVGDLAALPLHHLPAGAKVTSQGGAVAQFKKPGYARVKAARDSSGRASVVAAVDGDLVVQGSIDPAELGALVVDKASR